MYSRAETVNAVLRFYQIVIRHPYLNNSTLIVPPVNGWTSINIEGKNSTVLDLLCHLPYLRSENAYEELIIHWETIPICYLDNQYRLLFYPLPAHCIYLAHAESYLGTSLILDTNEGTITEFCHMESSITVPYEEYETLPEAEKWKAHPTTLTIEFLEKWTQRYEKLVWMAEEELLVLQGRLESWHVQEDTSREESELDREQHKARERRARHVADVYNIHIRHGWPDHFDKERCKVELLELEKRKDADERREMDEVNPDAALFD